MLVVGKGPKWRDGIQMGPMEPGKHHGIGWKNSYSIGV